MKVRTAGAFSLLLLVAGSLWSPAAADTVILNEGRAIQGEVRLSSDSVMVTTDCGEVTLPSWRVALVIRGETAGRATGPAARQNPYSQPAPAGRNPGPARQAVNVDHILKQTLSVDFDGAPFGDAVSYLQEVTGENFAVDPQLLGPDVEPVTLRLKDVTAAEALDAILEPRGLASRVDAGKIIRIGRPESLKRYVLHSYDVRDLLVNVSDRGPGGTSGTVGAGRSDGGRDLGQWGTETGAGGGYVGGRGGGSGGGSGAGDEGETLADRAESLTTLIMLLVAPDSWSAGGVIGGPQTTGGARGEGYGGR